LETTIKNHSRPLTAGLEKEEKGGGSFKEKGEENGETW